MSPSENPAVSVVVPAYNAASTLEEAYESVARQDGLSWEMIIVDNNSSDATLDVASGIADEDPRVVVVKEDRQGVSHARNRGIDEARGDYIAFFDADDIMGPNALLNRVRAIEDNPSCSLSYCEAQYVGPNLEPLNWVYSNREFVSYADAFGNPCAVGSALLGRTDVIRGTKFPPRTHGEDWLYLARLLRAGNHMVRADDCHVLYRQSADSAVHSKILHHERSCMEVLDLIYGPDAEVESADEWADGLSSPPLAQTKGRRLLRLLTYTLMAQDEEQANLAVGMLESVPYMSPTAAEVEAALTVSVARAGHLPRNEVREHWFPTLMTIARTARAIRLDERFPAFADAIDREVSALTGERWLPGRSGDAAGSIRLREKDDLIRFALSFYAPWDEAHTAVVVRTPDPDWIVRLAGAGWSVHAFEPGDARRADLYEALRSGMDVRVDVRRPATGAGWDDEAHLVDFESYMAATGFTTIDALLVAADGVPEDVPAWVAGLSRRPNLVIAEVAPPGPSVAAAATASQVADELDGLDYVSVVVTWPDAAPDNVTVISARTGAMADRLLETVRSGSSELTVQRLP